MLVCFKQYTVHTVLPKQVRFNIGFAMKISTLWQNFAKMIKKTKLLDQF